MRLMMKVYLGPLTSPPPLPSAVRPGSGR
jgi:hypothetical protein